MRFKVLHAVFFALILFSCYSCTSYKNIPYFQDLKKDSLLSEKINNFSPLTIQPGDLLGVHVSSLNAEADGIINYNLQRQNGSNLGDLKNANQNAVIGYLVDQDGNIVVPMIGTVKVGGLTTSQITTDLTTRLAKYLTNPNVNIRIQNFKVSVMGDVSKPGSYDVYNERITITEAIALAGDLNITGIRKNILLVREIDGNRQYFTIDLTSKDIFTSPYYYLKNNDVIYVQPNRDRVAANDSAYQKASLAIAALSILAILLTR